MLALREQLAQIRQTGIALDGGLAAEHCSIAVPVRDEAGDALAAVSITADNTISAAKLGDALTQRVLAAADGISARVGSRHDSD
jgi:DNA-binding IclR family transcriptional regulator